MPLGLFGRSCNPLAIDFGTESIKMLQLQSQNGQHRLVAAAGIAVPDAVRSDPAAWDAFAVDAIREQLSIAGFKGRKVVTCLPARAMAMQHFRMPRMADGDLSQALRFETAGKFPFDSNQAVIKHVVAGEVYEENEARSEVIVMAASRESVQRHLAILQRAKLEVAGIHVEPSAVLECFAHLFRRKNDDQISTLFIDLGAGSTHVAIAHGKQLVFAKHLQIGGIALTAAAADATGKSVDEARAWRADDASPADRVLAALQVPIEQLIDELDRCVRYYESIFPNRRLERAVFIGGEARHVVLCQTIAQRLGLPAILGDPLSRIIRDPASKCLVDTRSPQPGWAVAVGLGIGIAA
jgi:type IV pilus assembly protein PilM